MTVIQRFAIELPTDPYHDERDGWMLILTRDETAQLFSELADALYPDSKPAIRRRQAIIPRHPRDPGLPG